MTPPCTLRLWGSTIGAVSYRPGGGSVAVFEYHPDFLHSGIELAPLRMPLRAGTFSFPELSERTFRGLPGMLADSLPDKFGNQLIDKHLASQGVPPEEITAIDRLLYVSNRAMGGLEYQPARELGESFAGRGGLLDLGALTELAELTLRSRTELEQRLAHADTRQDALDLLRVGTSAGGARAKALVALGPGGELKVGYADHGSDHEYWLLKFDGITENRDRDGADSPGATVVEFIYSELARACGIELPRTRLLEHDGQRHFLIERFDRRLENGRWDKLHYSSWCGMAHAHRDTLGAYSYEQLVLTMRQLRLPQIEIEQLFRRAVFNVLGKNHDDHTKNFGFLMDRRGKWRLSPAFDLTYAFDPTGQWTRQHQITLGNKADDFTRADLLRFGTHCNLSSREAHAIIDRTSSVLDGFGGRARELGVAKSVVRLIEGELRATARAMKRATQ